MSFFDIKDIEDPYMPFGKYGPRGDHGHSRLSTIPDNYLLWLLKKAEVDELRPIWLNELVVKEWRRRKNG